jgi:hypothetical protein
MGPIGRPGQRPELVGQLTSKTPLVELCRIRRLLAELDRRREVRELALSQQRPPAP